MWRSDQVFTRCSPTFAQNSYVLAASRSVSESTPAELNGRKGNLPAKKWQRSLYTKLNGSDDCRRVLAPSEAQESSRNPDYYWRSAVSANRRDFRSCIEEVHKLAQKSGQKHPQSKGMLGRTTTFTPLKMTD